MSTTNGTTPTIVWHGYSLAFVARDGGLFSGEFKAHMSAPTATINAHSAISRVVSVTNLYSTEAPGMPGRSNRVFGSSSKMFLPSGPGINTKHDLSALEGGGGIASLSLPSRR